MTGPMLELSDYTADLLVDALDEARDRLRAQRSMEINRGPRRAETRKRLLALEREMENAIAAINTGEGLTRMAREAR